jgi:alkylated DNA repair dioxygenase AlkB
MDKVTYNKIMFKLYHAKLKSFMINLMLNAQISDWQSRTEMDIDGLLLIDEFISTDEEEILVKQINDSEWNTKLSRRTQHYGYEYSYTGGAPQKTTTIPKDYDFFIERLKDKQIFEEYPDQVIVNEYYPGQGILKHTDNAKYFGNTIYSLSLLSGITMKFVINGVNKHIYLKPRSLLVIKDTSRYKATHEIEKRKSDIVNDMTIKRQRRISITCRTMKPTIIEKVFTL